MGSWLLRDIMCFWYEEMIQSLLQIKKERQKSGSALKWNGFHSSEFVDVIGSGLLAGDASSWRKTGHFFCSQEFDHVKEVRVLIFGPYHLDNFCEDRESRQYSYQIREGVFYCGGFVLQLITFHFHVNLLLQLSLLLQRLLWHLGGAREADNDDADVVQAALQRETQHHDYQI